MRLRSFAVVVSCLALILVAFGAAVARPSEAPPPPAAAPVDPAESGPLVAPGPAPDIVLLYTGSVVGYVEPCG